MCTALQFNAICRCMRFHCYNFQKFMRYVPDKSVTRKNEGWTGCKFNPPPILNTDDLCIHFCHLYVKWSSNNGLLTFVARSVNNASSTDSSLPTVLCVATALISWWCTRPLYWCSKGRQLSNTAHFVVEARESSPFTMSLIKSVRLVVIWNR